MRRRKRMRTRGRKEEEGEDEDGEEEEVEEEVEGEGEDVCRHSSTASHGISVGDKHAATSKGLECDAGAHRLIFSLPCASSSARCRLKKIGISIFRPQTDVLDKENVSKNTKAARHSSFLTDRGKR